MNAAGVLLRDTNISELTKRAVVELDRVSHEWINSVSRNNQVLARGMRVLAQRIWFGEKDCCLFSAKWR